MLYIEVPDNADSIGRVTLADKECYIRFTWNVTSEFWSFSLYDESMNPLLGMTKMVTFSPLNRYYENRTELPDGIFGVVSMKEHLGRYSFVDGEAKFVFIPTSELGDDWSPYD